MLVLEYNSVCLLRLATIITIYQLLLLLQLNCVNSFHKEIHLLMDKMLL